MPESAPKLLTVDLSDPEVFGFSAANTLLAVGGRDGDSAVYLDLADGREVDRVGGIRFGAPDALEFVGDRLLATRDGAVVLHDPGRGVTDQVFRPDGVYALRVTAAPGGRFLAAGVNRGLILYDLERQVVRWHLRTYIDNAPSRIAFSPGRRYVAADFRSGYAGPGFLLVWDVVGGRRWRTLELGPTDSPAVVAFLARLVHFLGCESPGIPGVPDRRRSYSTPCTTSARSKCRSEHWKPWLVCSPGPRKSAQVELR